MEIITIIDTSDDESDCIEVNDRSDKDKVRQVKEVGIGASSAAAAPVHPVESECDGDESNDDSSSSFSSDDSIWNVTGLLSSLGVATRNNNNAGASSCSSTSSGSDEDAHVGNDTSPLCIISPSTNDKNQSDNDDDGSISSGDSIWNETGLLSRTTIIDEVENSTRTCPHLPKNNGYTNNVMKSMDSEACTNRKCSTIRSTDIEGNDDILSPDVPLHADGTWMIVLLMDHREFGCANNYLQTVEKNINNHFGGIYSEITTLPSADYMFVARLISNATGDILDERVLDMVIERKNVQDVCNCLISDSKKYKPLSFFEAQMYKLQHCGITKKLFLMEGDEDRTRNFFVGARSEMDKAKRLKRVKTIRKQLENGEFPGVDIICTRNRSDTIKFLIHQLEKFLKSFDPMRPPTKTMDELKLHINNQMKHPTFLEYLRLRKQPGIGDVKAMKVIMDPLLGWDKAFVSPSSKKETKATLTDRATFWKDNNRYENYCPKRSNRKITSAPRVVENSRRTISSLSRTETVSHVDTLESFCGVCSQSIDIWVDAGIISCNRVAVCGAIFHQICLKIQNYDIHAQDGCISCNATSQLKIVQEDDDVHHHKNVTRAKLDSGNNNANIIELDTDDDDDDTEVVVVHDC